MPDETIFPIDDINNFGFKNAADSPLNIWQSVDEGVNTPNDADFAKTFNYSRMRFRMGSLSFTEQSILDSGVTLRFRGRVEQSGAQNVGTIWSLGGGPDFPIELKDANGVVIANDTTSGVVSISQPTFQNFEIQLSGVGVGGWDLTDSSICVNANFLDSGVFYTTVNPTGVPIDKSIVKSRKLDGKVIDSFDLIDTGFLASDVIVDSSGDFYNIHTSGTYKILAKHTEDFTEIWRNTSTSTSSGVNGLLTAIELNSTNRFITARKRDVSGHILKFDLRNGNVVWDMPTIGGTLFNPLVGATDNGILVAGGATYCAGTLSESVGVNQFGAFVEAMDSGGNVLWTTELQNESSGISVQVPRDLVYRNKFLYCALSDNGLDDNGNPTTSGRPILWKINPQNSGGIVWFKHNPFFDNKAGDVIHSIGVDNQDNVFLVGQHLADGGKGINYFQYNPSGNIISSGNLLPSTDKHQAVTFNHIDIKNDLLIAVGVNDSGLWSVHAGVNSGELWKKWSHVTSGTTSFRGNKPLDFRPRKNPSVARNAVISEIELFVSGDILPLANDIPLYIAGPIPVNSSVPLYVGGQDSISGNIPLFVEGSIVSNSSVPLWISGIGVSEDSMPLYLKAVSIRSGIDNIPLFLWATTNSGQQTNIPLFLQVQPESGLFGDGAPLFITAPNESGIGDGMPLFLGHNNKLTNNLPLYIQNSTVAENSSIPLFMQAPSGTLGAVPISDGMPLYINRILRDESSIPLFISGPITNDSGIPLYLNGQPSVNSSIPLFINASINITKGLELYSHGF